MEVKTDKIIYNPLFTKEPVGAIKCEEKVTMKVTFPSHFEVWDVFLNIEDDFGRLDNTLEMKKENESYVISFDIKKNGLYWYYFSFSDCYGRHNLVSNWNLDAYISDCHENLWQLSVYSRIDKNVNWFHRGVVYQILPDRFCHIDGKNKKKNIVFHEDWNEEPIYGSYDGKWNIDFFGGNLKGIISKLNYLKKLNVTTIYLNPIFESASNHRYDIADYLKIDSMLGDEEDFKTLINEARKLDIDIILDMVFNHSGADSIYFNKYGSYNSLGAYQSKKSKYRDLYDFSEDYKHGYRCWWDMENLPSFNQEDPYYLNIVKDTLKKWIGLGAKGVRLDVVDELNNKTVETIHTTCKKACKDAIIIGEVWEDASNKIAYGSRRHYFEGKQLDSVMNYVYKKAIIDYLANGNYNHLQYAIRSIYNNYPKIVVNNLMNILDTHDTSRIINSFFKETPSTREAKAKYVPTDKELQMAIKKMKMATLLQFTLPGVPCVYYGDEALMLGFDDPFCRRTYPWDNINMDIYNWYEKITNLRSSDKFNDVFKEGKFEEVVFGPVTIFKRINGSDEALVIINNSDEDYIKDCIKDYYYDLLENKDVDKIIVSSYEAKVYKKK